MRLNQTSFKSQDGVFSEISSYKDIVLIVIEARISS